MSQVLQCLWVNTDEQKILRVYEEKVGRKLSNQRMKIVNQCVFSLLIRLSPVLRYLGHKKFYSIMKVVELRWDWGKFGFQNSLRVVSLINWYRFCFTPLNLISPEVSDSVTPGS